MLVRSPLSTSHKWRVCRCHDVFFWCYLCLVLLCFHLYVFVEAAALRPTVLRYAGAPIATHTCFFLFYFLLIWRCRVFRVFLVPLRFSLCMESMSYVLSSRLVFFYLVTRGWNFDISLICKNLINQSMMAVRTFFVDENRFQFLRKLRAGTVSSFLVKMTLVTDGLQTAYKNSTEAEWRQRTNNNGKQQHTPTVVVGTWKRQHQQTK